MTAGDLLVYVVTLVTLGIAYGLAYWVYRAREDRSARIGLLILFGLPGVLLCVAGAAFGILGHDRGWIFFAAGLGLCLPLVSPVRRFLARWTPLDPASPVDMAGLCVVLAVMAFLAVSYGLSPNPTDTGGNVAVGELVAQFVTEIAFAYILVGVAITRNFRQATARLGLVRPTWTIAGVGIGLVVVATIVVAVSVYATHQLQPHVYNQIQSISKEITSGVDNPFLAVVFGLGAGFGEELLLRGAIQPRFGTLTTSLLFALLHNQYGISFVLFGIFAVGLLLGLERKYLGTTASVITHAIFDTIAVLS